jgi:hypothetical protein
LGAPLRLWKEKSIMNKVSNLCARHALLAVAVGAVALAAGCSNVDSNGVGDLQIGPTVEVAAAALDLPNDYYGPVTVYVPVAPFDLPEDYGTRAAQGSDAEEFDLASADAWMKP